jgi:hypothetical protein
MTRRSALFLLSVAAFAGLACGGDDTTGPGRVPDVTIVSPADSSVFEPDELITFQGSASDPDGAVIDSLVWTSSRDGRLGEGASLVETLSLGGHQIRLRAYADDGGTGDATVFVSVEQPGAVPASVTIAFIGDQGWEPAGQFEGPRAVLSLIEAEGADAVVHLGDFDYSNDPAAWEQQIDDILGAAFPYFAAVGNHDDAAWDGADGYQARMERRLDRLGIPWEGDLGVMATLEYRGIRLLFGAPGIFGSDPTLYAEYFADRLAVGGVTWAVCGWHKNQRMMQVGGKGDETGWEVYERCREGGAIIGTAHEHSYSRTHLLADVESRSIESTADTLTMRRGASFVFVSGLGGQSIRDQELDGEWWASAYTTNQGAAYGALFGVFHAAGRADLAHFYFKDIEGRIVDEFWVVSALL